MVAAQVFGYLPVRLARLISVAALGGFTLYLIWRTTSTLAGTTPLLAAALLFSEILVLVELSIEVFRRWPVAGSTYLSPSHKNRPESGSLMWGDTSPASEGSVQTDQLTVVIPVDKEPLDHVRITALTAAVLKPVAVVLASAHYRPEIAAMAQRLGLVFTHGQVTDELKATRLLQIKLVNSLLPYITTKWFMVLTPGDAPHPETPAKIWVDQLTAVVPLGRRTSDTNSFDIAANLSWERRLDREVEQESLAARGLVEWRDFPALVRTEALTHVGGLVEDRLALLRASGRALKARGWKVRLAPPDLVVGPGAVDIGAKMADTYLDLRSAIASSKIRTNFPTLVERVTDISAGYPVLNALRHVIQVIVIAVVLITGAAPAAMSASQLITWVAAIYSLRALARATLRRGAAPGWGSYLQELRTMSAALSLTPGIKRLPFRIRESKGTRRVDHGGAYGLRSQPIQVLATLILDIGITVAAVGILFDRPFGAKGLTFMVFSGLATVHVAGLTVVLVNAAARRQYRQQSRLTVRIDLTVNGQPGRAIDLTSEGIGLATGLDLQAGQMVSLSMDMDGGGPINLAAVVTHVAPLPGTEGLKTAGLKLVSVDQTDLDRLYRYCGGTWAFERLAELDQGAHQKRHLVG